MPRRRLRMGTFIAISFGALVMYCVWAAASIRASAVEDEHARSRWVSMSAKIDAANSPSLPTYCRGMLMRFGCCVALASFVPPTSGAGQLDAGSAHQAQVEKVPDAIQVLVDAGCDFMEFGVGMVGPDLPAASFESFRAALADAPLNAECFNSFIAPSVRLVGSERDWARIEDYVSTAVERVGAVGGKVVVFGSGGARNVPDGYARDAANAEIEEFLRFAGAQGREHGVTIAIEPLNTRESNILTSVAEACAVAKRVGMLDVTVLADFYHMDEEDEPLSNIVDAGAQLTHVHVADTGRLHPGTGSYDYPGFWSALDKAGYDARISVECNWRDFTNEVAPAMRFLRESHGA